MYLLVNRRSYVGSEMLNSPSAFICSNVFFFPINVILQYFYDSRVSLFKFDSSFVATLVFITCVMLMMCVLLLHLACKYNISNREAWNNLIVGILMPNIVWKQEV